MAQEISPPPEVVGAASRPNHDNKKNPVRGGNNSGPNSAVRVAHAIGYESRRRSGAESTLETPHGREKPLQRESEVSEPLVEKFTHDMETEMEELIEMRREYKDDAEFGTFLTDSGHGALKDLYDQLVQEKPGTRGELSVNKDKLKAFMATDRGLGVAYKMKQLDVQEKAMAAAVIASVNPGEPQNGLIAPGSAEISQGGMLRGPARTVKHWWQSERGLTNEREDGKNGFTRITMGTKGRLTVSLSALNVVAGIVGLSTLGPPGTVLGPLAVNGIAGIIRASRRGETVDVDISANALRSLIGDPDSPTSGKRGPDLAKQKWMQRKHNLAAQDYEITNTGEVRLREGRVGMTGEYQRTLRENIVGQTKDIIDFQKEDNIPPELRRPMDIDWILEGTNRRPLHGTNFERKVMERFNPNQGGILDRNGNSIDTQDAVYMMEPETEEVFVHYKNVAGRVMLNSDGTPRMRAIQVPRMQEARDASGAVRMRRNATGALEPILIPVMRRRSGGNWQGQRIVETTTITDSNGNTIDVPIIGVRVDAQGNPMTDNQGNSVPILNERPANASDVITGAALDANGNPTWVTNPQFDWNNVDVAGNTERWLKANQEVLKEEVNIVFRSIVNGETDHLLDFNSKLNEAAAGHRSGKLVEAQKKVLSKEHTALGKDKEVITAEDSALTTFQTEIGNLRTNISKLQREQRASIGKIKIDGISNPTPEQVHEALQNALSEGNTTKVTINGQSIASIAGEYEKVDSEINGKVEAYYKLVEPFTTKVQQAEEALSQATTNQEATRARGALELARQRESGALAQAQQNEQRLREEDRYKKITERINTRRDLIVNAQDALTEQTEALRNAQDMLTSSETGGRQEAEGVIMGMELARDTFNSWGSPSKPDLATKSYDELVTMVNKVYESDPTKGWKEGANGLALNRTMLLHAMAEARASTIEPALVPATQSTQLTDLMDITKYGFSELDLMAMSPEEIKENIDAQRAADPALPIIDLTAVRNVGGEIAKRMGARQGALQQLMIEIDEREGGTKDKLDKLDSKGISTPYVDAIRRAGGRYGPIREEIMNHMPEQSDVDRLFGLEPPATTIDIDKAEENIRQLIFNEKQDYNVSFDGKVGPEAASARNKNVLSRKDLTDLMIRNFGLSITATSANDRFRDALNAVRGKSRAEQARFFSDTVIFEHLEKQI
jgi:hypothetical protein